jgi:ubiquitin-protein ligase
MSAPVKNIKRILKDYATLVEDGPENGIFVKTVNDDVSLIYMMIMGPVDSPYQGAPMFFTIEPGTQWNQDGTGRQYPVEPPRVYFHSAYSIRCHPNLYQPTALPKTPGFGLTSGGKVCLSILGTWAGDPWCSFMTFMTIAQTILGILDNHPLCCEPAYYNKKNSPIVHEYTKYVQYVCIKEATEQLLLPAMNGECTHHLGRFFVEEMCNWVIQHRNRYVERLKRLADEYRDVVVGSGGAVYANKQWSGHRYDYDDLAKKFATI